LGESETDRTFTQDKHDKYSAQTKIQKPADKYFRKAREKPGKFAALVIVLRFYWLTKKNAHALYRGNGPLRWLPTVLTVFSPEEERRTKNDLFVSPLGLRH